MFSATYITDQNILSGILVLIPHFPILNYAVTTFIFVCVAHEISALTGELAAYFVPPKDNRYEDMCVIDV